MSQLNLDTSPYFDDFDTDKDFYKVLFKPGFPVQARELTTLQSILQNQISSFGEHFFKEGSMVIPGGITYNPKYSSVILNPQQSGIDVSLYLDQLVGVTIRGESTGVKAVVVGYLLPPDEGVSDPTIFVSYTDSGNDESSSVFLNNEALINEQPVTYGNTTITAGRIFATTISTDSTAVGSAAQIAEGVYFLRGSFVRVAESTVVLEPYVNIPSYRVGLQIVESVINAGQDESLYDNAKGFNNFSAPGADRLQIKATLTKKPLNDFNDESFVELLRVENGEVKKIQENSQYNILKDYIAQRTYEESGDYVVSGLEISSDESLNNNIGNNGVYGINQRTDQGSQPSEDLLTLKVSSGKAYVQGYDINNSGTVNLDSPKPRETKNEPSTSIPFEMGSRYLTNNVTGTPVFGLDRNDNIVALYNGRLNNSGLPTGEQIGEARIYSFSLEDAPYEDASTPWSLYLFDTQIFTILEVNVSGADIQTGFRIKGQSSGATGYVQSILGTSITLTQVSGEFIAGESIVVNGFPKSSYSISSVTRYNSNNVKSAYQQSSTIDPSIQQDFSVDTALYQYIPNGFTSSDTISITSGGTVRCPGRNFSDFKVGDVIGYQKESSLVFTVNEVTAISADQLEMTVSAVADVTDFVDGNLPSSTINVPVRKLRSKLLNKENSFLYSVMEEKNISKVDLSTSSITFTKQLTNQSTDAQGQMTLTNSAIGVDGAQFAPFDQERYSVHYADGTIQTLNRSQVQVNNLSLNIYGLAQNQTNSVTINITGIKPNIKSKGKVVVRSETLIVSGSASGIGTEEYGLFNSDHYGLRVDDEEISLNYPDVTNVIGVYESLSASDPLLDTLVFANGLSLDTTTVKGEKFVGTESGTLATLISTPTPATVEFIYHTQSRFIEGETVLFLESNVRTPINNILIGQYNDITSGFNLDKGQREQFYDYSRLVRAKGQSAPNKKLLIVFDRFDVPASDKGDFYTANTYTSEVFKNDVPLLKDGTIRASDTLDFRPRVAPFTASDRSPFNYATRDFTTVGSTTTLIVAPNESMTLGYDFYLGRRDKVLLSSDGEFSVSFGTPAKDPQLPETVSGSIELAYIYYPPYLYDIEDIEVQNIDNRRYTMRDIGGLEDRIENLEELTALSLLELSAQSLQVVDNQGNDRFKSGFFADDFNDTKLIDFSKEDTQIDVVDSKLETFSTFNTIPLRLQLQDGVDSSTIDLSGDLALIDENTTKTGDLVTLDYDEVSWINQPLASRRTKVNPFNVSLYEGILKLNPPSDDFIITRTVNNRQADIFGDSNIDRVVRGTKVSQYVRERNISLSATALKPYTTFYTFIDGSNSVDIVPKLLEISMKSGTFIIGETVVGYFDDRVVFSARIASPNHKTGTYSAPSKTFQFNPYNRDQLVPSSYSASSSVLNIDIESLADLSDSRFYGYVASGMKIVGTVSGAVSNISESRLVTDAFGDVYGCAFIRDPYARVAPKFRLRTGIRTFRLTSSQTNDAPVVGNDSISFTETSFETGGVIRERASQSIYVRNIPPVPAPVVIDTKVTNNFTEVLDKQVTDVISREVIIQNTVSDETGSVLDNTLTNNIAVVNRVFGERSIARDRSVLSSLQNPLAQTFKVDETGAFLTSIDLYFAKKSNTNNVIVQIRPTDLNVPADQVLQDYASVTVSPNEIRVSNDASLATNIVFPSPIYLASGITYAITLLTPSTEDYEVWVARMGEVDLTSDTTSIISQPYLNGSMYKSQNGSQLEPSIFEDLKFKLYKASFSNQEATVYLSNPPIYEDTTLINNPITTLPRKLQVGISPTTLDLKPGTRIASVGFGSTDEIKVLSDLEAVGGPSATTVVTHGGIAYIDGSYADVELYPVSSRGFGAKASVTISGGEVSTVTITTAGTGYKVGDTVGIVTNDAGGAGGDSLITIDGIGQTDTLFLTNCSGEEMVPPDIIKVFDNGTLFDTGIDVQATSIVSDPMYSGDTFVLTLPSHGMQADNNVISLTNIQPDTAPTILTEALELSTNNLSVQDSSSFTQFEGITTSIGYAYVGGEVVGYVNNGDGSIGITTRGVDNTVVSSHPQGAKIYKYEVSGVSLRRVNTQHDLPINNSLGGTRGIDSLPIRIDRIPRVDGPLQINFNQEQQAGGLGGRASQNYQFNSIEPVLGLIAPSASTTIKASVRTVSGTSAGGSEVSFLDQGYEELSILGPTKFNSPRLIASQVNEAANLNALPQNKSFTIALTFKSDDQNLSPALDISQTNLVLSRSSLNDPIKNYADDNRVNRLVGDPHTSVYISKPINLETPASSLKVLLSAYRDASSDFRVLYRLFLPNSENSTEPGWELFPGYDNMIDLDGDGVGDKVIDESKKSGLPNAKVRSSAIGELLEYNYQVNDVPEFSGFQIKIVFSGTNEAKAPYIGDIRAIALA